MFMLRGFRVEAEDGIGFYLAIRHGHRPFRIDESHDQINVALQIEYLMKFRRSWKPQWHPLMFWRSNARSR
jgi:hypothetical protein